MVTFWRWGVGVLAAVTLLMAPVTYSHAMDASDAPEAVNIGVLQQYYEVVQFDHSMHVDAAEDCSVCHHHTTGTGTIDKNCQRCHANSPEQDVVGCSECHPANPFAPEVLKANEENPTRYHIDKPGLKAAYHIKCIGCHKEMDGPVGCEDCHAMTEAGKAFYHTEVVPSESGEHEE